MRPSDEPKEEREAMSMSSENAKPEAKQVTKSEEKKDVIAKPVSQTMNGTTALTPTINPFLQYGRAAAGRSFIGTLLKFNKFGEYVAGQDNEEIALGTKCAAHIELINRLAALGRRQAG
jgi:hypothetical protein